LSTGSTAAPNRCRPAIRGGQEDQHAGPPTDPAGLHQGSSGKSGKFVARVPRSLHTRLAARAEQEGVSMNTLVVAMLSEGVGARARR
jgi:hypothetical protein